MYSNKYSNKKAHIHFLGIGGIGMSGIAKILHYQGYSISGCDSDLEQKSIEDLKQCGCTIYQGNDTPACHDPSIDILVYSSALKADNPEIIAAQQRGIPTIPRAVMLAEIMRTKYSIAIAGAHGKTTTTSLISHVLIEAACDPTVIIGGHLKNISANARLGRGDFLVAETDESDRSLLRLYPTLAVVTNIDREHLDVYHDLEDIKNTFKQFLSNLPFYGKAILCIDDPHVRSLLPLPHIKTIKYGFTPDADIYADHLVLERDHSEFDVYQKHVPEPFGHVRLAMPGRHNVLNALATITVALDLSLPFAVIAQALENFKGVERRFSFKGIYKGAELFDDYGHHPTEIYNTLNVARKRAGNNLTVVFQPQRYSRTYHLWDDFIDIFLNSTVDHLIITDIYPASEKPIETVTSNRLALELIQKNPSFTVTYIPADTNFSLVHQALDGIIHPGDLVLFLGAGKVNKLADNLKNANNQ